MTRPGRNCRNGVQKALPHGFKMDCRNPGVLGNSIIHRVGTEDSRYTPVCARVARGYHLRALACEAWW